MKAKRDSKTNQRGQSPVHPLTVRLRKERPLILIARLLAFLLIFSGLLFLSAASPRLIVPQSPAVTSTPEYGGTAAPLSTPAPSALDICLDEPLSLQCLIELVIKFKFGAIGIFITLFILALILAFFEGVREAVKEAGKRFSLWLSSKLKGASSPERKYLNWFISQYEDPRFGPHSLRVQYKDKQPARLEEIYLPVEAIFELREAEKRALEKSTEGEKDRPQPLARLTMDAERGLGLMEALKRSSTLVVVGSAGSGKSTLLQWMGLACAHSLQGSRFKGQDDLLKALGKPLFPILIPLGAFDRFCQMGKREPNAAALLDFLEERYQQTPDRSLQKDALYLDLKGLITSKMRAGCLLLFDGVDEVDPERRAHVRRAVIEMRRSFSHGDTKAIITSRYSAQGEAQIPGARLGRMQPLDDDKRNQLISNLYHYYEQRQADALTRELIQRINSSDKGVQELAETPLMTTIFFIIHRPGHELPNRRAEVYQEAVEVLLKGGYRESQQIISDDRSKVDVSVQWGRLALVAFQLHLAGYSEEGMPEEELIRRVFPHFRGQAVDEKAKREEIREFLYSTSLSGGLFDEHDGKFSFRTHRSFQEYLAGWHLANNYAPYDLERQIEFVSEHLADDRWEEPVRLAVGSLESASADLFLRKLKGLGNDRAIAWAGLCLSDLSAESVDPSLRAELAAQMLEVIQRNPPTLATKLRFEVALALGRLEDPNDNKRLFDPRLHPGGTPEMVLIPAGRFRMGSDEEDEARVAGQEVQFWEDEKPAHWVQISYDYEIGKFPVTNAEYQAFMEDDGYDLEKRHQFWSEEGKRWLRGEWKPDLEIYAEDIREGMQRWLKRRPVELRTKPFFWEDRRLNAPNQPVVGVCWFEAEAYANWLSAKTGSRFRLPTEAEWEKAARFVGDARTQAQDDEKLPSGEERVELRIWPWGDQWDADCCNNAEPEESFGLPSPVGIYPHGASYRGALDLAGNVWEWCLDEYDPQVYSRRVEAGVEVVDPMLFPDPSERSRARAVRGGSWVNHRNDVRCASRYGYGPDYFYSFLGFRVVRPH